MVVASQLRFAIDAAFRAAHITIPFPQRDLWVKQLPPGGIAAGAAVSSSARPDS
jgi:small-conductance mechanosensitive channel